jgi:hypothetical protein
LLIHAQTERLFLGLAWLGLVACTGQTSAPRVPPGTWSADPDAAMPGAGSPDAGKGDAIPRDTGTHEDAAPDSRGAPADARTDAGAGLHGLYSFYVVSTIDNSAAPQVYVETSPTTTVTVAIPTSQTFTLVLDVDAGTVVVNSLQLPVTTTDGRIFTVHGTFPVYVAATSTPIYYGNAQLTVDGGSFTGSAAGSVTYETGFEIPVNTIGLGDIGLAGRPLD